MRAATNGMSEADEAKNFSALFTGPGLKCLIIAGNVTGTYLEKCFPLLFQKTGWKSADKIFFPIVRCSESVKKKYRFMPSFLVSSVWQV